MPASTSHTSRTRQVAKKGRTGPFVKYVGDAAVRTISPPEWRSLAIELKDTFTTHEWSAANEFMVESSQFSDAQLDYLLIDDTTATGGHSFIEVDYDGDRQLVQVAD